MNQFIPKIFDTMKSYSVSQFVKDIVAGIIVAIIALPLSIYNLIKKDTNILPFGPYLAISTLIILFTKLDINTIYNFFIS